MVAIATANTETAAAWYGEEGDHWTEHAERYEATGRYFAPIFDAAASIAETDHVVDIGCGTGKTRRDAAPPAPPSATNGWRRGRVSAFSLMLRVDHDVDVLRDLGRLQFDLAGFPVPRQLDALLTMTTIEHLHYGSDYPFTPDFVAAIAVEQLDAAGDPPGALVDRLRANTERLFPRVAGR
jgi:hypothetical protein